MSVEDDYRRWEEKGRELLERWKAEYPEAAQEIERVSLHATQADLDALRAKYPEAVAENSRIQMYSPSVIRAMRVTDPSWTPPE